MEGSGCAAERQGGIDLRRWCNGAFGIVTVAAGLVAAGASHAAEGMLFDQFATYGLTQNVHVPVLNVVGDFDTLSCQLPSCTESGSIENEGSNYPADACYRQLIVPNSGHALNLHRNASRWYRSAQRLG